ncbi:MAG: tRNA (adenosine(37)-N6)-threonylcarbamoyltransferase complex ATPase subunit type 1 TsaE [Burkholderiales bacterium]|nr:tRNA (adenosine(37)-N6)-threonylcarbamoyltransferase complex ATPase subunit type 1 TsaE [Burkholderiales bacterium]
MADSLPPLLLFLSDETETDALGAKLAEAILEKKDSVKTNGLNIRMNGDLGAGKTALTRALLRNLGYGRRVKSPTFTLLETYPFKDFQVNHFDFYRFESPEEFDDSGFREFFGPRNVAITEWTHKGEPFVPEADLEIFLEIKDDGRSVAITSRSLLGEELKNRLAQ